MKGKKLSIETILLPKDFDFKIKRNKNTKARNTTTPIMLMMKY